MNLFGVLWIYVYCGPEMGHCGTLMCAHIESFNGVFCESNAGHYLYDLSVSN